MHTTEEPVPRRKLTPRRLLIALNIVLAMLIISGIAGTGYAKWRFGQVKKVNLSAVLAPPADDGPQQPMTVLLVGSDTRSGLTSGQQAQFGSDADVAGQRSDTIMLLRVDPKTQRASILSLPRDLWVPIAGTNEKTRINSAFDKGPETLIRTIEQDFNIPIDHYAEVDFDSFRSVVNAIGGVQIPFAAPARDYDTATSQDLSGLNIAQAGCINLTGDQALAYVRSRHYQAFEGGRWRSDPQSDLSRIDRQQDFIRRVIRKAISKGLNNPITLNSLISSAVNNLTIDNGFTLSDMTSLARRYRSLDPSKVEMMTLPTSPSVIGGADVLLAHEPSAGATIDRFLHGSQVNNASQANSSIPTGSISIRVLNGSGVAGQATRISGELKTAGYVIAGAGDTTRVATTTIRYSPAEKDKADVIATYLQGDVNEVADSTIRGLDAVLVIGSSLQGVTLTPSLVATPNNPAISTPAISTQATNNADGTTSSVPSTTATTSLFIPQAGLSC